MKGGLGGVTGSMMGNASGSVNGSIDPMGTTGGITERTVGETRRAAREARAAARAAHDQALSAVPTSAAGSASGALNGNIATGPISANGAGSGSGDATLGLPATDTANATNRIASSAHTTTGRVRNATGSIQPGSSMTGSGSGALDGALNAGPVNAHGRGEGQGDAAINLPAADMSSVRSRVTNAGHRAATAVRHTSNRLQNATPNLDTSGQASANGSASADRSGASVNANASANASASANTNPN